MSKLITAVSMCLPLLAFVTQPGCATCKDELFVHIEHADTGKPAVGVKVDFRPPISWIPPPVWQGRTDVRGDLYLCVDFDSVSLMQMNFKYNDVDYFVGYVNRLKDLDVIRDADDSAAPHMRVVLRHVGYRGKPPTDVGNRVLRTD
jgi:hypothetical protein